MAGRHYRLSRDCAGIAASQCVPVALVAGDLLSSKEPIFVPEGTKCVIVSNNWLSAAESSFTRDTAHGGFEVAPGAALALILLHELGHVDELASVESDPSMQALVRILGSRRGDREVAADVYAAKQLKAAQGASALAMAAALEITLAAGHISWNLLANRLIDHFGATTLRSGAVFGDKELSHPNMELRFLIVQYVLTPTDTSRMLLEQFVAARENPGAGILFRQPETLSPRPER
jgi:hypothetical protein